MTDRSDHLIERAAALLRSGPAGLADTPPTPTAAPAPGRRAAFPPPMQNPLLTVPGQPARIVQPPPVVTNLRPAAPPATERAAERSTAHITSTAKLHPRPGPAPVSLDTLERAGLVVARSKRTRIAEEYRIVIGRILRALHEVPDGEHVAPNLARNLVLVTSARPGEGKSFTALNLAGSIAQNTGESVLLVDLDPKIRPISDQLGLGGEKGFLDLVADPALQPEAVIHSTVLPNLSLLPLGTRPNTAATGDTGTNVRPVTPVIERLARQFPDTLVMLDAPPCLSTSDPHTLASHVRQVVMVVEAERTQRNEVEAALDLIRACPTITLLLNKVRLTTSHTFGAYDYFGSYT